VPEFGALYAPYLVKDISEAATLLHSDEAIDMLDLLPRRAGVVGIAYGMGGMRQILTRQSMFKASDLRGRKIRITPFPPIRDFYLFLGSAPTPMPLESVYDALANGQVAAIDMDLELIVKLKYYELAQTVLLSNHMMFPMVGLVSARVWVRLAAADQELIRRLMKQELDSIIADTVTEESSYLQALGETGIEIVPVGEAFFGDAVRQWDDTWRDQAPVLGKLRKTSQALTENADAGDESAQ
jgi:TRAP-type C4-dicarboxylate transport system substrate-binding protein